MKYISLVLLIITKQVIFPYEFIGLCAQKYRFNKLMNVYAAKAMALLKYEQVLQDIGIT
jgi:hypothetical protein